MILNLQESYGRFQNYPNVDIRLNHLFIHIGSRRNKEAAMLHLRH